jgi:hypothetical protein
LPNQIQTTTGFRRLPNAVSNDERFRRVDPDLADFEFGSAALVVAGHGRGARAVDCAGGIARPIRWSTIHCELGGAGDTGSSSSRNHVSRLPAAFGDGPVWIASVPAVFEEPLSALTDLPGFDASVDLARVGSGVALLSMRLLRACVKVSSKKKGRGRPNRNSQPVCRIASA